MKRVKVIAVAVCGFLVLVVLLQNTETVKTKLLFATISMPRAAMLFGTLLVGFGVGLLTAGWLKRKSK